MNKADLLPTINLMKYTPPGAQQEHQVDTLMQNLMRREKEETEALQQMMESLQRQAAEGFIRMKQQNSMTYLPNG